ncbi:MAG: M23 family peptidase, partial [Chloroflexi bacterium]
SLRFFPHEDGFAALVGIDAFTEPGEYTLRLEGSGNRPWQPFQQNVPIQSGNYGTQQIVVSEELAPLLAPEVRQEEDAFLSTIYSEFTEPLLWDDMFQVPVTSTVVTAGYGDGRSYNGGPITIYHSGIDFSGTIGTPILAPANGIIVYTGDLELRGQTVIINHGVGIMSAYFHLSEIFVNQGDEVAAGLPIGAGGSTGLSTGPHLHWDLRIMDVPVDGDQWLQSIFP